MERFNETISDDQFIKVYLGNYADKDRQNVIKSILTYGICQLNFHNDKQPSASSLANLAEKAKRMNIIPKKTQPAGSTPTYNDLRNTKSFDNCAIPGNRQVKIASKTSPKAQPVNGYDVHSCKSFDLASTPAEIEKYNCLKAKQMSASHKKIKSPQLSLNLSSITGEKPRYKSATPIRPAQQRNSNDENLLGYIKNKQKEKEESIKEATNTYGLG